MRILRRGGYPSRGPPRNPRRADGRAPPAVCAPAPGPVYTRCRHPAWWYLTELPQGRNAARAGELFQVRGVSSSAGTGPSDRAPLAQRRQRTGGRLVRGAHAAAPAGATPAAVLRPDHFLLGLGAAPAGAAAAAATAPAAGSELLGLGALQVPDLPDGAQHHLDRLGAGEPVLLVEDERRDRRDPYLGGERLVGAHVDAEVVGAEQVPDGGLLEPRLGAEPHEGFVVAERLALRVPGPHRPGWSPRPRVRANGRGG